MYGILMMQLVQSQSTYFLKLLNGLTSEAKFYQRVAPQSTGTRLVPCYAATYDDNKGHAHVLLADISATHGKPPAEPPYETDYQHSGRLPCSLVGTSRIVW